MNIELEQKLADKFSFMRHRNHPDNLETSYKAFGCECGDGWFQLLWDLCTEIENIYKEYSDVPDIRIDQIKEKFGKLRFYYGYDWEFDYDNVDAEKLEEFYKRIENVVSDYEDKSGTVCELCGAEGTYRSDGRWVQTRCDDCEEKHRQRMQEYLDKI